MGIKHDNNTVLEKQAVKLQPPSMYQVLLLNDDYTPMEFVVFIIQEQFNKDVDTAMQIMMKVHVEGRAVCGVYTKDVALTKVDMVLTHAKQAGHPLQCVMEKI